jgi:hypothetical protein
LLSKNSDLTFTFNKAVKAVDIDTTSTTKTTGFKNLSKDSYDAKISEDGKTVTFTPKIGYWELDTSASTQVVLTAEAVDGTTKLEKTVFPVYFDNKVWVSVKDLSYADYNDYRKLSDPIVLVFSKPMNEKIAVNLTNNKTAYTEKWNEADAEKGILANTELTLTPDAKVGYWDIGSNTSVDVTITSAFANSKESYIDTFGYWKVGAATDGSKLTVYFDNYNDVTLEKVSDSEFTVTFAKALKALTDAELDKNVKVYSPENCFMVFDLKNSKQTSLSLMDIYPAERFMRVPASVENSRGMPMSKISETRFNLQEYVNLFAESQNVVLVDNKEDADVILCVSEVNNDDDRKKSYSLIENNYGLNETQATIDKFAELNKELEEERPSLTDDDFQL